MLIDFILHLHMEEEEDQKVAQKKLKEYAGGQGIRPC